MVNDKEALYVQISNLLLNNDLAVSMGAKAYRVIVANSGATAKTIQAVSGLIGA
jgi:hypothetical protein